MAIRMQQRRGTSTQWTSGNPTLASGEIGFETDTGKFKIGDGTTAWASLKYFVDANSILDGAPGVLDTLNELAAAINDDPAFFTTVATNLSNHEADTTNVHGITNTALLVTTTGTQTLTGKTISAADNTVTINTTDIIDVTASAAELNILDGVTATTAEINLLDGVTATTAELNILDGVTASASEINILDGATLTTTELNYVDGVTSAIQTQLDAKLASSTASSTYAPLASPTFTGTVTLPTGTVTSGMILDGTIVNADINASAAIALSKLATDPLARANHTGTQTASTISNFDTQVRTSTLDQMAAPTASVSLNSQKITSLATPTASTDAANKQYVDDVVAGLNFHEPVKVATTANIAGTYSNGSSGVGATLTVTATGALVIDGVTTALNDRILVKDQTTQTQNGIYYVSTAGATGVSAVLTRATDADNSPTNELKAGDFTFVTSGTANTGYGFVCNTSGAITIGTTNVTYATFNTSHSVAAGTGLTEPTAGTLAIDSTVTTLTGTQTLTNKTIALGSNTVSGTIAQFNTAVTDADFATIAGTETLTNKTLSGATLTGTTTLPSTTSIGNVSSTELGYLDGVTSAIQTQIDAKTTDLYTFTTDSTTARTLSLSDKFASLQFTSGSAVTVTIPTNASVAFPTGSYIELYQWGAGQVSVVAATPATTSIRSTDSQVKLRTQYSSAVLVKVGTDEWLLTGDLTA